MSEGDYKCDSIGSDEVWKYGDGVKGKEWRGYKKDM